MKKLYCKVINGKIERPKPLLESLNDLTNEELVNKNYYPFIVPKYDPILQTIDGLIFDIENNIVTKNVIDLVFDINVEKTRKINDLNKLMHEIIYWNWDWYATRKIKFGTAIPKEIIDQEFAFKTYCDKMKNEINNFTVVRDVLSYNIYKKINMHNNEYLKTIKLNT